jgi:SAM-dependent methyltransferase
MRRPDYYYRHNRSDVLAFVRSCNIQFNTLLDVGAGDGEFLASIDAAEKWGVDPNGNVATPGPVFIRERFEDACDKLPNNHFDLICLNDVLEHVPDDRVVLSEVRKKLSPRGWLVVSIPNARYISMMYDYLICRDWRYADEGILDRTHIRFYTRKSAERLFKEAGFVVERRARVGGYLSARKILFFLFVNIATLFTAMDSSCYQYLFLLRRK